MKKLIPTFIWGFFVVNSTWDYFINVINKVAFKEWGIVVTEKDLLCTFLALFVLISLISFLHKKIQHWHAEFLKKKALRKQNEFNKMMDAYFSSKS